MNDRFKFRAWDKNKKVMIYEEERTYDGLAGVEDWNAFVDVLNHDNYIVEQCTGLKDKNGRLIYEGDIVKVFGFKDWYILVCRFRDSSFCLDYTDGRPYNFVHSVAPIEVIGNIHENRELLK